MQAQAAKCQTPIPLAQRAWTFPRPRVERTLGTLSPEAQSRVGPLCRVGHGLARQARPTREHLGGCVSRGGSGPRVDGLLGEGRQLLVRRPLLVERLLQEVSRIPPPETLRKGADCAVAGDLIVLHALGG